MPSCCGRRSILCTGCLIFAVLTVIGTSGLCFGINCMEKFWNSIPRGDSNATSIAPSCAGVGTYAGAAALLVVGCLTTLMSSAMCCCLLYSATTMVDNDDDDEDEERVHFASVKPTTYASVVSFSNKRKRDVVQIHGLKGPKKSPIN